ncbi:hypothetical protein HKX48_008978 [Thoreauomyces humboldtii]|nr:hypothetical protein HKX48_008978 [Thoreauomyces humboldtii]
MTIASQLYLNIIVRIALCRPRPDAINNQTGQLFLKSYAYSRLGCQGEPYSVAYVPYYETCARLDTGLYVTTNFSSFVTTSDYAPYSFGANATIPTATLIKCTDAACSACSPTNPYEDDASWILPSNDCINVNGTDLSGALFQFSFSGGLWSNATKATVTSNSRYNAVVLQFHSDNNNIPTLDTNGTNGPTSGGFSLALVKPRYSIVGVMAFILGIALAM